MTSRERWTVYPLLFLAIGLAVRSTVVPEAAFSTLTADAVETGQVVCRELVVTGQDGTVVVHVGRLVDGGGGRIEIKDGSGVELLAVGSRPETREGVIEFYDDKGEPASALTAESGGR